MTSTSALSALGVASPSAVAEVTACAHCGLAVPDGFLEPNATEQFCCAGCRAVFQILKDNGLDQYYRFADRRTSPVTRTGRTYAEFDHPAFQSLYVREGSDGLSRVELYLEGVHCASCVWLVERVPLVFPGVVRAELNVGRSLATIDWDGKGTLLSQVAQFLESLGYAPHPYRGVRTDEVRRKEDRAALVRIGIAGAIAVNVMLPALAMYSGWLTNGIEADVERFFRWISFALTIPAVLGPGRIFFSGAWAALRTRALHLDLPIAIALGAGVARGAINTITDAGPIYFDGVCVLIFLLLIGRYLQHKGQRAATDASELLSSLTPNGARVVASDGSISEVPATALLPGMVLDVRAGETLAADGVVLQGASSLDVSLLTGESRPVTVGDGAAVYAGTLNVSAPLRVRIEQAGEASRVARILRQVEESSQRRAPIVLLANRMAGAFVAVILLLAVATFAVWYVRDPSRALDNAVALLIVTCPCALAMATPLAVTVAAGRGARRGIFIKGGDSIEALSHRGEIFLDKTGTITEGRTSLVQWEGDASLKPLVLALEAGSTHPLAEGFRRAFTGIDAPAAESSVHVSGSGIRGRVAGRDVMVGSPSFVASGATPAHRGPERGEVDESLTPVWIAVDGVVKGYAGFGDAIRPDAKASIDALRSQGWRVRVLSGDAEGVVRTVGRALGLSDADCLGEASPEAKLQRVQAARASSTQCVVMVGDGVNDAAAMAASSVGVAVHGGAEASLTTSDIYLTKPGLASLVELTTGATNTMHVIRRNIAFSLVYNAVGVGLAVTGVINPLFAAIMMPLSSLTVVLGSWHGRTFERTP